MAAGVLASFSVFGYVSSFLSFLLHPLVKLALSFLIVWTAFGFRRFKFFLQATLTFYITTFIMGGGLIGLHYFLQYESQFSQSLVIASVKGFGDPISWVFVIIGFPVLWFISTKQSEKWEMSKIRFNETVKVYVEIADLKWNLTGLVDSGNQLYDPISKLPVMILSTSQLEDQIPSEILQTSQNPNHYLEGIISLPQGWDYRLRMIPARTVGQSGELLVAFKPDQIVIETKSGGCIEPKGLIAFSSHSLSSEGMFDCIIHPKMMTKLPHITAS
ncbi:stage II sporulation protein GA (sporulation sigma-E factor processing peptidase) [Bacillus oleivorans]|uniref:Sporulation sigma-E factor-processing peptidase n=1 Tax=Bacillus oleivorans TaxID=1448271 RepID=A0A285D0U8_9BACI|nr:stage II sporulation protein GA (sporulation sigma-E factor processing peptidase) [Bacillus oleivorans]